MAMLAEPRRKARYIVNPTGKDWLSAQTDDGGGGGGQFGQRMLQSMGWRAGQGLGKDGQGAAEPIKVKRKSDQRGVGCSGAYAADTMPQSVDFASLLSELNAAHGTGSGSEAVAAASLVPAVSLEAKSRASRARLHYQKFTRGKDVSAYDKQSLACIFGSRAARLSDDGAAEDGTGGVQEGGALATAAAVCMGASR